MIRRIERARLLGAADTGATGLGPDRLRSEALVDIEIASDGTIAAVTAAGSTGSGPAGSVDTLDAAGRFVTSGLWDEHVHLGQWAQQASRLDFGELTSAQQVLDRVAAAAAAGAQEIIAMRVRGSAWGDELTRERIDAAGGDVPVVLISVDLHGAWLSSAALRQYGHDALGASHLVEDECFALLRELDRIEEGELDRRISSAASAAAARGVVGVVDFEMRWGADDWTRREASGFDALRVESAVYPQHLERAIGAGFRTGDALTKSGRLRFGPLKVITDGSLGTHTAWCCEPYPDGEHGLSLVGFDELEALLRRAHESGISAAVHAIGDRAGAAALDAFERVGCGGRIEHAQLLRREDVARFAALGVEASVQPEHLIDDRDAIARLWPGRAERAFPFASLLNAGARLRFGSDAPVAPLDPWRAIAAAVHRSLPGEPVWVPAERLTVEQALRASMRGKLRPAVGDAADLVLLDENPLRMSQADLAAPPVAATLLGGKITHADAGLR